MYHIETNRPLSVDDLFESLPENYCTTNMGVLYFKDSWGDLYMILETHHKNNPLQITIERKK